MSQAESPVNDPSPVHANDRGANFYDKRGRFYLQRCYICEPNHGRENYAPMVATGDCAWCGWSVDAARPISQEANPATIAPSPLLEMEARQ